MNIFQLKNIKFLIIIALFTLPSIMVSRTSNAQTADMFNPGRIIDDSVFFNANTMTTNQIQSFLNAKVPVCETNHPQGSYPYPPPYVCLKDYSTNTDTIAADSYCNAVGGGVKSAATIIKEVAAACSINPQVLLVLLQKEQILVTDTWPLPSQYTKATGFGCPDSDLGSDVDANNNNCYDIYEGFFKQVYYGARQYQRYAKQPNLYTFKANQTFNIQFNPNSACGSSPVFIQNQATAGLYNYTPYQPNQAALNNLYGTGNSCSAYGNRNFWRMFKDWFGSTRGLDYDGYVSDISISTGTSTVQALEQATITITAKNTGNQAWSNTNYPVKLGTWDPTNHESALYDSTWPDKHRVAVLQESIVQPGSYGTFTFKINPPNRSGLYQERFNLVSEGSTWFSGQGYLLTLNIVKKNYTWSMVSQSSNKGFIINPGDTATLTLIAKNTGNVTWSNSTNPVRLGTWAGTDRNSVFYDPSWPLPVRAATLQESTVPPGSNGTFVFNVKAPTTQKLYIERFNLVSEGKSWFEDPWMEFNINIKQ